MKKYKKLVHAFLLIACSLFFHPAISQSSIKVTKVWDQAKHNAFPDLFQYKNFFYATFREGTNHVGNQNDGKVRLVRSKDLKKWETVKLFELPGVDVREARLSAMPDGRILVTVAAGVWKDKQYLFLKPYVAFSDKNGKKFGNLEIAEIDPVIKPEIDWIWRMTWHNGVGYGILYQSFPGTRDGEWLAHLVKTTDGKKYERVTQLNVSGKPNECTIRFDEQGKMYIMVRREGDDRSGWLGTGNYPYTSFTYQPLGFRLGGPNFLFLNSNELVMGSRFHEPSSVCTAIFLTDLNGKVKKTIKLPSNGDSSYPGLVIHKDKLWVLYYSSHEGKTSIYMAEIPLSELSNV